MKLGSSLQFQEICQSSVVSWKSWTMLNVENNMRKASKAEASQLMKLAFDYSFTSEVIKIL